MNSAHRTPLVSLAAAGVLSGLSVPLSKLALPWAGPAWLTVARFALATPVLAFAGRHGLRAALTPGVMAAGAVGFGLVVLLQSAGIARTSVSHASVVIGVVPVFVALIDASRRPRSAGSQPASSPSRPRCACASWQWRACASGCGRAWRG